MSSNIHKGFSALEGMLVILVIGIVGVAGYFVIQRMDDDSMNTSNTVVEQTADVTPIETSEDLESANDELEQLDIDDLDTSELENLEDELL